MNADQIKGKWQQIKGDLQKTWGKITDDEWDKTKGESSAVTGLVQNKYGQAKEEVSTKVSEIYDKHIGSAQNDYQGDDVESREDSTSFLNKQNDKTAREKTRSSEF